MFRAYNRYVGRQCGTNPRRLKWAGLLPLRDSRAGVAAIAELQEYGATAAVVFGTAGERMLSHESFAPVWDEFARCGLPLCVHMGRSYPPLDHLLDTRPAVHTLAMGLPAQLAFVAIVAQGMLDRYPELRVAFLEFGAEWLFYVVGRLGHYWPSYQRDAIARDMGKLALSPIEDYVKSGRLFVAPEAHDSMLLAEMGLIGEGQILFASDYPHGEGRDDAASEFLERTDLSDDQKRRILYDNAVRFYGAP
jgi:predicted TIM-barrel fold metal-dependent hydrolase